MNVKALNILEKLLNTNSRYTIRELSENYNVTERTIYNYLDEIEEMLRENNLPKLEISDGKYYIDMTKVSKESFIKISDLIEEQKYQARQYDQDTRVKYAIFLLLISEVTTTQYLSEQLNVSVSTIKNDIKEIRNSISASKLELVSEKFKGMGLSGNEINKRELMTEIILENYTVNSLEEIDEFYIKFFESIIFEYSENMMDRIIRQLKLQIVDKYYAFFCC